MGDYVVDLEDEGLAGVLYGVEYWVSEGRADDQFELCRLDGDEEVDGYLSGRQRK